MKKSVAILLLITLTACSSVPISISPQTQSMPAATPLPDSSIPLTQAPLQSTYSSSKYGYLLNYPNTYNIVVVSDEYVEIGEKITVEVMNVDPTAPRGDGAFIESTSEIQFSGHPAKLLTGYIGSVGGYIPQQFKRISVERNSNYFVITLYALGLHVTDGDISQIAQLAPEDVSLFDSIAASMQIP